MEVTDDLTFKGQDTNDHTSGIETVPRETLEDILPELSETPDATPDKVAEKDVVEIQEVKPGLYCWELYQCVLVKKCFDFNDGCFNQCSQGAPWKKDPVVTALQDCAADCASSVPNDLLWDCIGAECQAQAFYCMATPPGEKKCGAALECMQTKCTGIADEWDSMLCLADCVGGLATDEADKLVSATQTCAVENPTDPDAPAPKEEMGLACISSLVNCIRGSGDKSCAQVTKCMQQCPPCKPPVEPAEGEEPVDPCKEKGDCEFKCVFGVSDEGADALMGSMECQFNPSASPFGCIIDTLQCHPPTTGQNKVNCAQATQAMASAFYSTEIAAAEKFPPMQGAALQIQPEDFEKFMQVLFCLDELWKSFPSYGAIPKAPPASKNWENCSKKCSLTP